MSGSCYWIACCVATDLHTEPCLTVWLSDCWVSWMCRKNIGGCTTPWPTRGVCRLTYITLSASLCWHFESAVTVILLLNILTCVLIKLCSTGVRWMSMWHWWNNTDRGKPKYLGKPVSVPLRPQHSPRWLAYDWIWTSMVRGQWLTTWAMAWLCYGTYQDIHVTSFRLEVFFL